MLFSHRAANLAIAIAYLWIPGLLVVLLWRLRRYELPLMALVLGGMFAGFILTCALTHLLGHESWAVFPCAVVSLATSLTLNFSLKSLSNAARSTLEAERDPLTGLPSRAVLRSIAPQEYSAFLLFDLDQFKAVNDTAGHPVGDAILKVVGKRLRLNLDEGDVVIRMGGDEFAVLTQGDLHVSAAIADQLCARITQPYVLPEGNYRIGVSCGMAAIADDLMAAYRQADIALYVRKGDRALPPVVWYRPEMGEQIDHDNRLTAALRQAIAGDALVLYYQPIMNIRGDEPVLAGFEALVRWNSSDGLILPSDFIPLAEKSGLITDIAKWGIAQAHRQAWMWAAKYPAQHLRVSFNLSANDLRDPVFLGILKALIAQRLIDPRLLMFEVTENALAQNTALSLESIQAHGAKTAVDDFGTGWNSLLNLLELPLDLLKIDRQFISGDRANPDLTACIIALARVQNLEVCAEGVENASQLASLRSQGCDYGQGYLFGRPMCVEDAEHFIEGQ